MRADDHFRVPTWRVHAARRFDRARGVFGAVVIVCACVVAVSRPARAQNSAEQGRLSVRVNRAVSRGPLGLQPLKLGVDRDGFRYVPASYRPERPMPLVLALHGAGGAGSRVVNRLIALADSLGVIIVAPDSRGTSWDVLRDGFGVDVRFIGDALRQTFTQYNVDTARVAIAGFSDGASYALSLGQMNGDLFTSVIAFSPGFQSVITSYGHPRIYIAHGTRDEILNIDRTSRVIVPKLKGQGYKVEYREFDGTHSWPPEIVHEAFVWFLK